MIPIIRISVDRCNYSSRLMPLGDMLRASEASFADQGSLGKSIKRTLLFNLGLPDFSFSFI